MVYLQTSLMTIIQPDSRLIKTHLSSVNNVEQARTNVYLSLQFDDMPGLGVYHQADGERPQQSLGSVTLSHPPHQVTIPTLHCLSLSLSLLYPITIIITGMSFEW